MIGILIGCSGGKSPVSPQSTDAPVTSREQSRTEQSRTGLLGYFDIYFDFDRLTFEAVPNRNAAYTLNIVPFLNLMGDPLFGITFGDVVLHEDDPDFLGADVEFRIHHPFPGLQQYNAYDLMGVLICDSSMSLAYNGLAYPVKGQNTFMKNPDGYTRWFNPTEFTSGLIFGYEPGGFQTCAGNSVLNPYKYYCQGLGKDENAFDHLISPENYDGFFTSGLGRTMELEFPMSDGHGILFGYAVMVAWEDLGPDGPFHPYHHPEALACRADVAPVLYWDGNKSGGKLVADIDLFSWISQPSNIIIESTVLDNPVELNAPSLGSPGGDHYSTYHVEIPADPFMGNSQEFWVIAEYSDLDYKNGLEDIPSPDDPLASFFRFDLPILDESIAWIAVETPSGGEVWNPTESHEITWTSEWVEGTVRIEYSKDNFASDINVISSDEENDGSYLWTDIPYDPSDTVRIRVSSTGDPGVCGISNPFTISSGTITVVSPNGGEKWYPGEVEEIAWDSEILPGTVKLEFSRDNFDLDCHLISDDEENDGSFLWTVPDMPSNTVYVRITSNTDPLVSDKSDNFFSICGLLPGMVENFSASDGGDTLGQREVRLTWDPAPGCVDFYDIERLDWIWYNDWSPPDSPEGFASGYWDWQLVHSEPATSQGWLDTDARYSSEVYPIRYRISARNQNGSSFVYSEDTGYPVMRNLKIAFWCWAEDQDGTNSATTWQRAMDDYTWLNDFWNDYGLNFVSQNPDHDFLWVTNPVYKALNGSEPYYQHVNSGKFDPVYGTCFNVYYNESWNGKTRGGWCWFQCVPELHTSTNIFVLIVGEPWDPPCEMLLPHEFGHGLGRMLDQYALDKNRDLKVEPEDTCLVDQMNLICWPEDWYPFCDDAACYPQIGDPPNPKNLMWYGWLDSIDNYELYGSQYGWVDAWVSAYGVNFPWP